jgi:hypothetical protein
VSVTHIDRHPEEPRILRGVSKDGPQALAAILRDAAKRPLLRMTGSFLLLMEFHPAEKCSMETDVIFQPREQEA